MVKSNIKISGMILADY